MLPTKDDLKSLPTFAPLIAAVIAPLSTLLDIPALTEPWFFQHNSDGNGLTKLPDPHTNIVLSAVGLAFNVLANWLLLLRFSVSDGLWRYSTRTHACDELQLGIAFGNVLAYGILSRNIAGISYGEGFWLFSLVLAFIIFALLLSHYLLHVRGKSHQSTSENQVREDWTYLQAIYFSVVSILTIGFGDFYPTKPVSQIVFFPFVLVGIVQLASLIELLVRFLRGRLTSRRIQRRREFERRRQEKEDELEKEPSLEKELEFLRKLYNETDRGRMAQDLLTNCTGFLLFWVLGALIFSQIESWTYGQGLYFCYVFFLTIGFGDYVPVTPAGRVVFILYSIMAVPIMASFAIQTIQSIFQKFATNLLLRREAKAGIGVANLEEQGQGVTKGTIDVVDEEKSLPRDVQERLRKNDTRQRLGRTHTDFITSKQKWIDTKLLNGVPREDMENEFNVREAEEGAAEREMEREREEDRILTEYILELAVELEKYARRLLLGHMKEGTNARMLLKADRIVQLRNIKALAAQQRSDQDDSQRVDNSSGVQASSTSSQDANRRSKMSTLMQKYYEEEADLLPFPADLDEQETLQDVAHYREAFAGLLAAGSRLLRLKDEEKFIFERRFWRGSKE
ncbi:voltage-gated potassium channel [Sanghuangporus baumii]|uniref:Voltage-gated potassium channel n=1 Tax=Sanghuangporus baumii TaxID=108892 RepID=A0A9Q5I0H7_SANBA|nr:voltage-gated potassium channel [Sanghuangporus baumii]